MCAHARLFVYEGLCVRGGEQPVNLRQTREVFARSKVQEE